MEILKWLLFFIIVFIAYEILGYIDKENEKERKKIEKLNKIIKRKEKYCERYELCREDKPCQKQCELCENWDNKKTESIIKK